MYDTVNDIINDAALEMGIVEAAATDVFSATDPGFNQLCALLKSAGREFMKKATWQELIEEHTFVTADTDDGVYDLPDDFDRMIPQTHWNRIDTLPLFGPLSPQDWQYIEGRSLAIQSLYMSFRLRKGKVYVFPNDPVPDGKTIAFEYIRNTWVTNNTGTVFKVAPTTSGDLILYPPILIKAAIKAKFLEAKGFDSTGVRAEFNEMWDAATGQDKIAPIINAGGGRVGYPYLDGWRNVPDTGYGGA